MKKLFVLGGSFADIPIIEEAKKRGFYVITSGNRANDIGHKYSDNKILADYSNKDLMLDIVKKNNFDFIIPSCNDFSMVTTSYIAEKLKIGNYDSYNTTLILHHKDKFREFLKKNSFNTPIAKGFNNFDEALSYAKKQKIPFLIKPVDLTGGKGIVKIKDYNQIEFNLRKSIEISKEKRVVIEEFIDGSKHGCSCIVNNGKIEFSFFDNEIYYINQYLVAGAYYPSTLSINIKDRLLQDLDKIIKILLLKNGILHVQFIVKNNKVYIIEITRRHPGDLYINLVDYSLGINYSNLILKGYINESYIKDDFLIKSNNFILRHCVMTNKNGIVNSLHIDKSLKQNIYKEFLWYNKGYIVSNYCVDKLGIIFFKFNNIAEMKNKIKNINNLIKPMMRD